jgi:asparagine synthase (glutamine-hydrolysing)
MCGIAGIIQTDVTGYTKEHLQKMTDALAHRGPDGEGRWEDPSGHALLGHRRLSIIDLTEAGCQPMSYLDRYTIIHNGEVYNYIELKEELAKKNYSFRTQTDTEVIVAAYDCWKDDCVTHFDGMFAFAIWDRRDKILFAARDRFGEKPFFYHIGKQTLLFGSEMKALWAAGVERTANLKMLFNFITIGYTDNPADAGETFFENISKLPPATTLRFSPGDKAPLLQQYWEIDPGLEDKKISDEEALERFQFLFNRSVQRRLRSDVTLGTSLSGGLDSSAVVAMMKTAGLPHSKTFTAVFPGFEKDESAYSKQVAGQFGLEQFTTSVTEEDLLNDWQKISNHQEEPFGSASIVAQYKIYALAKQQDVKVLLDGQGADETLAGYPKYYKWYWQELFRKRKLSASKELRSAKEAGINESFNYKNMIAAYFPGFATVVMENQYLLKAIRQPDLTRDFVRLQSKEAYYTTPDHFTLNGALHFNTCVHGLEELLRYADRNAMAHGREIRLPFLSHELVEFIFSLPAHYKIRDGWTKWILRKTMEKKLPGAIAWRRDKVGFEPPQKRWMENKEVQEAIREAKTKLVNEKILRPEVLQRRIQSLPSHAADNYDWRYFSAAGLFR